MAALPVVLGVVGADASVAGLGIQAKASSDANAASARAEKLREQQMNLESQRQARQVVRNAISARSAALVSATNQGASAPGSSGLAGGQGQIAAQAGYNIEGVSQSNQIGEGIFRANADYSNAQTLASFGSGLSSFGQIISGIQIPGAPQ